MHIYPHEHTPPPPLILGGEDPEHAAAEMQLYIDVYFYISTHINIALCIHLSNIDE